MQKSISLFAAMTALLVAGCNSNNDDNATPAPAGGGGGGNNTGALTINTPCSVNMTVNGTTVSYSAANVNEWTCGNGSSGGGFSPGMMVLRSYSGFLGPLDWEETDTPIDVTFGSFQHMNGGPISDSLFFSYFHTGNWQFGDIDTELGKVEVGMWENGVQYSTKCGSGDQTGSSLEVTEILEHSNQITTGSILFRVVFNCTLYPCGIGEPKTITNGTAVLSIANL